MKSIYLKNFAATALIVLVAFLLVVSSFTVISRSYVVADYRRSMANTAAEVSRIVTALSTDDDPDEWNIGLILTTVAGSTGNRILLADPSGTITACSDNGPVCRHIGMKTDPDMIAALLENGTYDEQGSLDGESYEESYISARTVKSSDGTKILGFIFVTGEKAGMLGAYPSFVIPTVLVGVIIFVLAMLFALAYSKHMAKPLDEMAAASRRFARGDFSVRVNKAEDVDDEMGVLIESFNTMADSLEKAEERRSEFISNVAHELRTPMTTIAGFADGILDGTIPKESEEKYLTSIRDETRRLSRLVRSMLDVSQLTARIKDRSRYETFDLGETVALTLINFESRATAKDLDVDPQLPVSPVMVKADKDAIVQVIYNLIDNAVKFAENGSCITIRVYRDDEKAYFSVKDKGETIPEDDLPYIFDRFHKSDRSRSLDKSGVGLGLYLVKEIVNSHDEDIAVTSKDGITEFVFTLTLA